MILIKAKNFIKHRSASALVLTMFIMAGMLLVALNGAYVVSLGLQASGVQAQSTKAYYAAESGSEFLLWELRKNGYVYTSPSETALFDVTLGSGATYSVYYSSFWPLVFQSIGEYQNARRSVEIRIGS